MSSRRVGEETGPEVRDRGRGAGASRDVDTVPFPAVSSGRSEGVTVRRPDTGQPDAEQSDTMVFEALTDETTMLDGTAVLDRVMDRPGMLDRTAVFERAVPDTASPDTAARSGDAASPDDTTVFEPQSALGGADRRTAHPGGATGHQDDYDDVDEYDGAGEHDDEHDDEEPPMGIRRRGPLLVLGMFATIIVGGSYLLYRSFFGAPDYEGAGQGDVIVEVHDGDTISAIGATLTRVDVVRSQKTFTRAAADDDARARSVQPGYYKVRLRMSGESAVKLLLDPRSRVGQLELKGGAQLDDTRGPDGTVASGVLTLAAQATCTQLNGNSTCVGVNQLRETMATAPLEVLGVPDWARAEVAKAEPNRRLEGLIAPGRYDVRPGSSAEEVLKVLVTRSAAQYEASGLRNGAGSGRYSPYQLLVVASLIEKEGTTGDFEKVAGVIYNRMTSRTRLELDSTINYPLDLQAVRTNAADRSRPGPYNSYANYGLPPTPIGAPGTRAIDAALHPAAGPWMFFVKCHADGTSCFATTLAEHQNNVRAAQAAGVY